LENIKMLYNAIEGAVANWSKNTMPVLVKLFGVPITVLRQTTIEEEVVEPEPTPEPEPEPTPEPTPEPEPEPVEEAYVPEVPKAPSGFMGNVYGGMINLSPKPEPEPTPEPEPEPVEEVDMSDQQEAVVDVYGSMAGQISIKAGSTKYKDETFDTILIPPSRSWETNGHTNIGGFEVVEVFTNGDLIEGDRISFKRRDGKMFYYRVNHETTLGITENLLTRTQLIPIEVEAYHGR
jgi:hypothetical protein